MEPTYTFPFTKIELPKSHSIKRLIPDNISKISEFISKYNQPGKQHCLHTDEDKAAIEEDLIRLHNRKESQFFIGYKDETIAAFFGAEWDEDLQEGWLWGPFVTKNSDWNIWAKLLYAEFHEAVPNLKLLNAYFAIENKTSFYFFEQIGYKTGKTAHVYQQSKQANIKTLRTEIRVWAEPDYPEIKSLHEIAFPNTYYSFEELLQLLKDEPGKHYPIVWEEKGSIVAYLFATLNSGAEGYIHFLAVNEDYRRKGIASHLLAACLKWAYEEKEATKTTLTVLGTNSAQKLYEQLGFKRLFTGVGQSKRYRAQ